MTTVVTRTPLESVLERTTAELERWHVPALELAVVRRGDTLYADALGAGAGPRTLFHHGSCGKAYTGLLAAVLAEEGVVDLDAPVRRYVPELRLPDPVVADRVTIRDLVSHRSGLGRHDLAWILNSAWSRQELVRRLEHLPLVGDLRNQLHYSNFGYTLAGLALGRAAGSTWEEQVHTRVLDPLGMHRTFVTTVDALRDPDCAAPHLLRDHVAVETAWRITPGIGPAGEILSCAEDSVRWLTAQLGVECGVSTAAVAAAQQPQMLGYAGMAPFPEMEFFAYAMGWLVGSYRGHKLVWHNGGIDGFTTQTLLLPEREIGVVACANQHMTNFPLAVVLEVADALLGVERGERDWFDRTRPVPAEVPEQEKLAAPATPAAAPAHALGDYVSTYRHAGYGDVVVGVDVDGLSVRVGECAVAAKHRHYETWDLRYDPLDADFPLTFATNADGAVIAALVEFEPDTAVRFDRLTGE